MNNPEFFNVLDYIWLAILFVSLFVGFIKGFIKDFFGTCVWVGSSFLSSIFSPYLVPRVYKHIPNLLVAKCAALVIAFVVLLIAFKLIINTLSESVRGTCLSGLDRLFGACFGLVRGVCILITIPLLLLLFGYQQDHFSLTKESKISTILYKIANILMPRVENVIGVKFPLKKEKKSTRKKVSATDFSKVPIAKNPLKKVKKEEEISDDIPSPSAIEKLKDYIADVFATRYIKREADIEEEEIARKRRFFPSKEEQKEEPQGLKVVRHINKKPEVDKYKKVRPKFGFMQLLDDKKKRLEELRRRKLKKQIKEHLGKEMQGR